VENPHPSAELFPTLKNSKQARNLQMKHSNLLTKAILIAVIQGIWISSVLVQSACAGCGGTTDPGTGGGGGGSSNDPAFVMKDPAMKVALQQQQASVAQSEQPVKKPTELVATEQEHYQAYMDSVKKHPEAALSEAVTVWKGNDSADLQRLVIFKALEIVTSSEDSETLQFMLKALDGPEAQRQECARLGRGNSLEKTIAAKRITMLESNPKLQKTTSAK
jgi:hypothetical protein